MTLRSIFKRACFFIILFISFVGQSYSLDYICTIQQANGFRYVEKNLFTRYGFIAGLPTFKLTVTDSDGYVLKKLTDSDGEGFKWDCSKRNGHINCEDTLSSTFKFRLESKKFVVTQTNSWLEADLNWIIDLTGESGVPSVYLGIGDCKQL
jgi:hypothetical protein